MDPVGVTGEVKAPLTGCDAYFLALEDLMRGVGQGMPAGLTVLELESEPEFDALEDAARRLSMSHPLLHARLVRRGWFGMPCWEAKPPWDAGAVRVVCHDAVESLDGFCSQLLETEVDGFLELHLVRGAGLAAFVAKWRHVLFDGRGAELLLRELAAFAMNPDRPAQPVASWGEPFEMPGSVVQGIKMVQPFLRRYDELKVGNFKALGGAVPRPSLAKFRLVRFDGGETRRIHDRADAVTGGIFLLPYFLAVAARAHAAVFRHRNEDPLGYQVQTPVQVRRRREAHPIFQNQVGVLPFHLEPGDVAGLRGAVAEVQRQFETSVREGVEGAFGVVLGWMRHLPPRVYRRFLQFDTGGQIASFFHSHTGEFLKGVDGICGARIADGWHVPTVSQPPGTGIFFSERRGRLTATIAWREGCVSESEVDVLEGSLRRDLLGEGGE